MLALLFGQSQRSFYANEIIAFAAMGSGAVQRELAKLVKSALITVKKVGNQKHYQANHQAPIFDELRSIVMKTFGVADVLRVALQAHWPQIELAFVYGSMAKGNEQAHSDIDLMVIGEQISNAALLDALQPLQQQLGRIVNPTLYTPAEFIQRVRDGKSFIVRVLEQPKIFVKGREDELIRLTGTGESGADLTAAQALAIEPPA
ncbi:nucleotidyltransferase domain-containing protein [Janthinobacterium sp. PSPC3-1]|uniref:nucleotidyltransferase domain-containing protein n=1 Tax=Janthinobacterium sp. PSPC3-1 TaxID=2804653 RepID=UPI003CF66F6A